MTPDRIGWPHLAACLVLLFGYTGGVIAYAVTAPDRFEMGGLGDE